MNRRILSFLVVSAWASALQAQDANFRPGTTDPAGNSRNLTLFRDEQIYSLGLPSATGAPWRSASVSFDANLNPTSTVSPLPWSSEIPVHEVDIQTAVGRILKPDKDDVVVAQRSETDGTKLAVRFKDGSGLTMLGNLPPRSTGYADFFATSVGDLDNLYDSQGNYHDEVVVAWMEPNTVFNAPHCFSAGAVPHIAVLNYNGGANPTVLAQTINRDDNQYLAYCILDIYNQELNLGRPTVPSWAPQPGDNIIATSIGDFDGDGHNELAVAYMRGTAGLVVSVVIYRYQNDGTNASLTPVNNYEVSIPNRSMVATLSLSAGNFDGSGVDQLLVGSAAWWGTPNPNGEYTSGTFVSQPVASLLTGGQTQGSITAASSSGQNNSTTDFTVNLGSGVYMPQTVTIAGAVGSWSAINGSWAVTPTSTGFTLDIDSSAFGSFIGQNIAVTTAAPLTQSDSVALEPIPGTTSGGIEVDNIDVDAFIRVQTVPGLFHYDPNNGFDYRRRQVAMAWNSRASPTKYPTLAQDPDTHLAILQITNDDKIQIAAQQNGLVGSWQLFQNLSMTAGAVLPLHDAKSNPDPTWSIYVTGVGLEFDHNQPYPNRNVYRGMVAAVWKLARVEDDPTKVNPDFVCSDKATSDTYSPYYIGAPLPLCSIWVDAESAVDLPGALGRNLNYLRLPAIAADVSGNSLRLGAPMHMELTDPGKPDYVLEQPPQHAAWLDQGNGAQVVTISRYPSFSTSVSNSSLTTYASNEKDHTDWTAGVSEKVTAQATWAVGADAGPLADVSEQSTAKLSARVSFDYDHVHDHYTTGYDTYSVGLAAATGEDDSLFVQSQIFDLWRYRIYGQNTDIGDSNNPNAFYDIVIPGPHLASNPGGRDVDWYQPIHEVGNILSYPGRVAVCGNDDQSPADIGPITIPNLGISNQVKPLAACQQLFYNGNSHDLNLTLFHQTGSGDSTDYTNKVSTGVDFKYSYRVDFEFLGNGGQAKASTDTDVHGGQDWGHLSTNDSTTNQATGITLHSPQGDSEHAYPFYPIFYNTSVGGLKVAYGVGDLTSSNSGENFWVTNYSAQPDPALNLPNRFDGTYSSNNVFNGWKPELSISRKRMKGFVIRKSEVNSITGDYSLLGSNPQDGDKVLLEARVYNYSISATPANFTVQFSLIPYDSGTHNEICANMLTTGKPGRVCPASARTVIGIGATQPTGGTSNFTLDARENAPAYLMWSTQGFGPQSAGFTEYRVYVDLVSNTAELYPPEPPCAAVPCEDNFSNENKVDPGQNNEGWGLISVAKRSSGGSLGGSRASEPTHGTLGVGSANTSLVLLAESEAARGKRPKRQKRVVAYLHQPLSLRISGFSSAISNLHGHVSIFDGKPGNRYTKTVAIKTLHGVTPDGTSSWFTWTPQRKGPHHLYAVIQTARGPMALGDVLVNVRRAPGDLNGDGRVDRHDLNMLNRDLKKNIGASACGEECDLDGDSEITQKDADLMVQLCDSQSCAFAKAEYVGGSSPAEPDMRALRSEDDAATTTFFAAHPQDKEAMSNSDDVSGAQLYGEELQRKQSLRSVQYWYKGKPVTSGPLAQPSTAVAKR